MRIVSTAKNICFLFCSSKVQDSLSLRKVIDESTRMILIALWEAYILKTYGQQLRILDLNLHEVGKKIVFQCAFKVSLRVAWTWADLNPYDVTHLLMSFNSLLYIIEKEPSLFSRCGEAVFKSTLIEKDHMSDWSPEKDYTWQLTFWQPVQKSSSQSSDSLTQLKIQESWWAILNFQLRLTGLWYHQFPHVLERPQVLFSGHGREANDTDVEAREKSAVKLFTTCQLCSVGRRWIVWYS